MSRVVSLLRDTRTLLAPPGAWTQGAFRRDAHGAPTVFSRQPPTCRCLAGGIVDSLGPDELSTGPLSAQALAAVGITVGMPAMFWNDAPGRTQDEVLAALDGTIARLETAEIAA